MSGSLPISQIPPNFRVPLAYMQFSNANAGALAPQQRTLIIGDSYNTVPNALVPIYSAQQAATLFGIRAPITKMITVYFANDPLATVYALPYTHVSGATAAAGTVNVTGTTTTAGTIPLYIDGISVPAVTNVGDTNITVANAIATAINANTSLPVYSTGESTGDTNVVASNLGISAGQVDIRLGYQGESIPAGLTITVTPMSGGTANPSLSNLVTVLGAQSFDFIICQYGDATNRAALTSFLNDTAGRWSASQGIYGHAFYGDVDTFNNLLTLGAGLNDQHSTTFGIFDSPTTPWEWVAAHVGAIAGSLRADPARPLQTLQVQGVCAPPVASQFNKAAANQLLNQGIATSYFDHAGNTYVMRAVTEYQTNALGQADQSYLDTETLFTLMLFGRTVIADVQSKFARQKLADDGTRFGAGQAIVTPSIIKAEMIAQYNILETAGQVEDTDAFAAGLIVQRSATDASRVDVLLDPYLVSGLRIFAALTSFTLNSATAAASAAS